MVSCDVIESLVYGRFTGTNRLFEAVDLGKFPSSMRPGMNVAVTSGSWRKFNANSYKASVQIVMLIAVRNLASETERRKKIHPLVEAVYGSVIGVQLSDDLDPIEPGPWEDRSSVDEFQSGITKFQLSFTTSMTMRITKPGEEINQLLESLIAEYSVVQDPQSVGVVVAVDEVSI